MGTGAGCFPSGALVYTESGPRDIDSLRKGDRVLAAADDGKMIYSEVSSIWYRKVVAKSDCTLEACIVEQMINESVAFSDKIVDKKE